MYCTFVEGLDKDQPIKPRFTKDQTWLNLVQKWMKSFCKLLHVAWNEWKNAWYLHSCIILILYKYLQTSWINKKTMDLTIPLFIEEDGDGPKDMQPLIFSLHNL